MDILLQICISLASKNETVTFLTFLDTHIHFDNTILLQYHKQELAVSLLLASNYIDTICHLVTNTHNHH